MREHFAPTIYLLASQRNGTLYAGVTSNLTARVHQHRQGLVRGFTRKYGIKLLVWFEGHDDLQEARRREAQIKEWKRAWKVRLIEEENFDWNDLYPTLFEPGCAGPGPRPSPGSEVA